MLVSREGQRGRQGTGAVPLGGKATPATVSWSHGTRGLQARPPVKGQDLCGQENTQHFWKVGFTRVLLSKNHGVRMGSSGPL